VSATASEDSWSSLTGEPTSTQVDDSENRQFVRHDDNFDVDEPSTAALFEGDAGTLDLDQRKALVVLLKQRFISAQTHPREWAALVRDDQPFRSRLNDLFMELHLDRQREVAYKRQVSPEGGGRAFPTLMYDTPWSREETILLVYLRGRLRTEQASGADRAFVDRTDMLAHIEQYRPAHVTDLAGEGKRAAKAVETVFKAGLLIGSSTAERFEISQAIEVLLPQEKLEALLAWLKEQNADAATALATDLTASASPADRFDRVDVDDVDDVDDTSTTTSDED
jgi:hypothetical protein